MISETIVRKLALSFPEVTEAPHFEKTSFRIRNKIFLTYDNKNKRACIKLSEIDQSIFSEIDRSIIYPLANKWGQQGWTIIELNKVDRNIFFDALTTSYCEVAPKKLANEIRENKK